MVVEDWPLCCCRAFLGPLTGQRRSHSLPSSLPLPQVWSASHSRPSPVHLPCDGQDRPSSHWLPSRQRQPALMGCALRLSCLLASSWRVPEPALCDAFSPSSEGCLVLWFRSCSPCRLCWFRRCFWCLSLCCLGPLRRRCGGWGGRPGSCGGMPGGCCGTPGGCCGTPGGGGAAVHGVFGVHGVMVLGQNGVVGHVVGLGHVTVPAAHGTLKTGHIPVLGQG